MDLVSIITAVGASGVISGLFTWLSNRRKDAAQAGISEAEYTARIIQQADSRVAQHEADAAALRKERDEAREECKGQRKAKQEWRDRYMTAERQAHEFALAVKDAENQLAEEKFHRCEINGCRDRKPPRSRSNTPGNPEYVI